MPVDYLRTGDASWSS